MRAFSILFLSVFSINNIYANELIGGNVKAIEEIEQMQEAQMQENLSISKNEYKEYYDKLNNTLAGFRYRHMEPAEVLGIEAKSQEDREYFAKIVAKSQHERVEKEIAFQNAVTRALAELYPGELAFELTANEKRFYGDFPKDLSLVSRFMFVANIDEPSSAMLFNKLKLRVADKQSPPIDIYFVGASKDKALQKWAAKQNISMRDVKLKRITLNYHKNEIERLTGSKDVDAPIIAYTQNGKTNLISLNGV